MRLRRALAWGLLWGVSGCADFPVIEADVCGNAVIEKGEDCDTFDVELKGLGAAKCRPQGVEGACHFDCTAASDGTRAPCPGGMGCANDGLCRAPTGEYDRALQLTQDASSWLSSADFDGDGRMEVISTEPEDQLQQARFRLHYFDHDARLDETRTFPRFTTRPIARDVTNDGLADLMFSNGRVGLVPGRKDRSWVPAAFSSYVIPNSGLRVVGVRDDAILGGLPIVALATVGGVSGLYVPIIGGRLELRAKLSASADDLAGAFLAADVITDPSSPCSEVILGFRDEHRLRVFDVCEPSAESELDDVNWRATPLEHIVELPRSLPIHEGPLAGDVDGDGHIDVVFASGPTPYVVYGTGAGLGSDARPLELSFIDAAPPADFGMPLAMGDFTGDGVADYVMPQQLLVSRQHPDGSHVVHLPSSDNRRDPWTMAQIDDLNGNGFPDVVAASAGATGFTFHNGTGGPYVIGARVATQRPVRFLSTGDFDGDLLSDLAIVEQGLKVDGPDMLAIAFGARDNLPLPASRVAEVAGPDQLGSCSNGSMDTLFLATSRHGEGRESTFTLFDGSPDRLPFATYSLVTFTVDSRLQDLTAAALTFGAFSREGANDILALGSDLRSSEWSQWLVPDIGGLLEPPRLLEMEKPPTGVSPLTMSGGQSGLSHASATADLDGDKLHEVLWLMPDTERGGCVLLIYDIDAEAGQALEAGNVLFEASCPEPELAAVDLDRDGHQDVLVLLGNIAVDEWGKLEVLWNDGGGRFSASRRTTLMDERVPVLRAFSVLGESSALVLASDSAVHIARLDRGERSFLELEQLSELQDGRSVVVTDPNGDGVLDILAADAAGLWLLKAQLR